MVVLLDLKLCQYAFFLTPGVNAIWHNYGEGILSSKGALSEWGAKKEASQGFLIIFGQEEGFWVPRLLDPSQVTLYRLLQDRFISFFALWLLQKCIITPFFKSKQEWKRIKDLNLHRRKGKAPLISSCFKMTWNNWLKWVCFCSVFKCSLWFCGAVNYFCSLILLRF